MKKFITIALAARAPRHRSQQGILSERHLSGVWSQLSHRMERERRRAQHLST